MARITKFVDDMDGSEATVQTRYFSVGNTRYRIDLSDKNYAALLQALQPYISTATVAGAGPAGRRGEAGRTGNAGKVEPVYGGGPAIKAFAASVGAPVPLSRPTNELVRRWIAAHPDETAAWEQRTGLVALDRYR